MADWGSSTAAVSYPYTATNIKTGVWYWAGVETFYSSLNGYPAESDVKDGVVYGPNNSLEGSSVGGGETSHVF